MLHKKMTLFLAQQSNAYTCIFDNYNVKYIVSNRLRYYTLLYYNI